MTHAIFLMLKLEKMRVALMCVFVFGDMKSATSNSSLIDPISSPRMFSTSIRVPYIPSLTSFFVWDKTTTSFIFASKIKTA
jgi:hypothetical protein